MDLFTFLQDICAAPGVSGQERAVAEAVARAFEPLADAVSIDPLFNVAARMDGAGPRIMVTAHQDEIGMTVIRIEDDGCLRVAPVGLLQARVLPAHPVTIHTVGGPLFGVVGAKPPHLLTADDQKKAVQYADLFVDIGFDAEAARQRVRIGDPVTLAAPLVALDGTRAAGKSLDDRACVAAILLAAERIRRMRVDAEVLFVSASQEEVGSRGARVQAYAQAPDAAIVLDVTHADVPGSEPWDVFPIDKPTIAVGPNMHPALTKRLRDVAEQNGVAFTVEPIAGNTYTDAGEVQLSRRGVPTVLIGLPMKYMHTSVELIDLDVVRTLGRLTALFVEELARGWEAIEWN